MTTGQVTLPLNCTADHCEAREKRIGEPFVAHLISRPYSWFETIRQAWKLRQHRRTDRDAFNTLLRLDDRALQDIGVSREDVLWASRLPLTFNAAQELEKLK